MDRDQLSDLRAALGQVAGLYSHLEDKPDKRVTWDPEADKRTHFPRFEIERYNKRGRVVLLLGDEARRIGGERVTRYPFGDKWSTPAELAMIAGAVYELAHEVTHSDALTSIRKNDRKHADAGKVTPAHVLEHRLATVEAGGLASFVVHLRPARFKSDPVEVFAPYFHPYPHGWATDEGDILCTDCAARELAGFLTDADYIGFPPVAFASFEGAEDDALELCGECGEAIVEPEDEDDEDQDEDDEDGDRWAGWVLDFDHDADAWTLLNPATGERVPATVHDTRTRFKTCRRCKRGNVPAGRVVSLCDECLTQVEP